MEKRRLVRGNQLLKTEYNQFTHQIRHSINADYENWCDTYCEEIEALQRTHQTRAMHRKINILLKGSSLRDCASVIGSKSGAILTTEGQVKDRWREYCSELYDHKLDVDPQILDQLWHGQPQEEIPDILESEIKEAISKLKNGKAVGIDGVSAELIKHAGELAAVAWSLWYADV